MNRSKQLLAAVQNLLDCSDAMKQRPSIDPSESETEAESDLDFDAYRARTMSISSMASSMSMAPTPGATSSGQSLTRTYSHTSMNSDVTVQESQRDDGYPPYSTSIKANLANVRALAEQLRHAL